MFRRIRKSVVPTAACLLPVCAALLYRMLPDEASQPPRREVIECDLGDVPPGTKIDRVVKIRNHTHQTRSVKSIIQHCSCFSALKLSRNQPPPGEHCELMFQLASPTARGRIEQTLDVTYHERLPPTVIVVRGTVGGWVDVDRDKIDFAEVCVGKTAEQDLVIDLTEAWPESERAAELLMEHGTIVSARQEADKKRLIYRLAFAPPNEAAGNEFTGELVLRWRDRPERVLRGPCVAKAVTPWTANPSHAFFGIVGRDDSRRIELKIRPRAIDGELPPCKVNHVLGPEFEVQSSTSAVGDMIVSVFLHPKEATKCGYLTGEITLLDPDNALLASIPVSALVK